MTYLKPTPRLIVIFALAASFALPLAAQAKVPSPARPPQADEARLLIPIGGGYSDIYAGFSQAAIARAKNGAVNILVLPTAYSTNPTAITDAERALNMRDAEARRFQIEEACKRAAPAALKCSAVLLPVFTRADALDPAALQPFTQDLAAIFALGGDQTVAMQVLVDTPLEQAMADAYARGVLFAGTSAGGGLQSAAMLGGYAPNFAQGNSLDFGAADVWNSPGRRGLSFGITHAIVDQHFFQRGRMGRLINAIALPGVPHVGVGIDAYTGVYAPAGRRLENVFGLYTVAILDAETYHAADAVQYRGPNHTLSLRNILVHLLAPGPSAYDLVQRQHSLGAPAPNLKRDYAALALPGGAGPLILAGHLGQSLDHQPALERFVQLSGNANANILIIAAGYPTERSARTNADKYAAALGVKTLVIIVPKDASEPIRLPADYTAILFIGKDQSLLRPEALAPIKTAWLSGKPVLADGAAAAVIGKFFSAHAPTPEEAEDAELATQKSFLKGQTNVAPGLGLVNLAVEPQVLDDNRWGRLFSLAYTHPDLLALGLNEGSAIELGAAQGQVLGDKAIFVLDLRTAKLALGANQGFVIANGLLDVFAGGDTLKPEPADVKAAPTRIATPALPTLAPTPTASLPPSPTPVPTATPEPSATATPLPPTPVPAASPPAAPVPGAGSTSSWLGWAVLIVGAAAILGAWLLRRK